MSPHSNKPNTNKPRPNQPRRTALPIALAICVAGALAAVFLPVGWQINRFIVWLYYTGRGLGVPEFVRLEWYDVALNVLLFAVPVCLAALYWRRVPLWVWPLLGGGGSLAIELIQHFFLPREFSLIDIAANTAGALIAALAAGLIRRSVKRRQARQP